MKKEADLTTVSFPISAMSPYLSAIHKMTNELDRELLDGLVRAGFKLNEDPCGLLVKYWRDGGVCLLSSRPTRSDASDAD